MCTFLLLVLPFFCFFHLPSPSRPQLTNPISSKPDRPLHPGPPWYGNQQLRLIILPMNGSLSNQASVHSSRSGNNHPEITTKLEVEPHGNIPERIFFAVTLPQGEKSSPGVLANAHFSCFSKNSFLLF